MVSRSAKQQLFAVGPRRYPGLVPYLSRTACSAQVALMLGHDKGWSGSRGLDHAVGPGCILRDRASRSSTSASRIIPTITSPTDDVSRIDRGSSSPRRRAIALFVDAGGRRSRSGESAAARPVAGKGPRRDGQAMSCCRCSTRWHSRPTGIACSAGRVRRRVPTSIIRSRWRGCSRTRAACATSSVLIAAVLHDTIEDTATTVEEIAGGSGPTSRGWCWR